MGVSPLQNQVMENTQVARFKIRKYLPLLIILVVTIILIERQKEAPPLPVLPAPQIKLISQEMRAPNDERDFMLPDLSGEQLNISDLKGRVVLLNFFATWCPPCRDEMPAIEEVFQTYRDKGFVVLGISRDEDGRKAVEPFVKEFSLTFPVVLDPEMQVFQLYFVRGIPVTYLLDRQGRIAGMHIGPADWNGPEAQTLIEQLLEESVVVGMKSNTTTN